MFQNQRPERDVANVSSGSRHFGALSSLSFTADSSIPVKPSARSQMNSAGCLDYVSGHGILMPGPGLAVPTGVLAKGRWRHEFSMETFVGNIIARILADRGCGHNAPTGHKLRVFISGQKRGVTRKINR
jgi:hypothetical protein